MRTGNQVFVSGTTSAESGGSVFGEGDAYLQARRSLEIIEQALQQVGAELRHVVRTRMFVTDISRWEEVARAHGDSFSDVRPAATLVQVQALIDPRLLVEIEVDAVIDD